MFGGPRDDAELQMRVAIRLVRRHGMFDAANKLSEVQHQLERGCLRLVSLHWIRGFPTDPSRS